ncbi:hypothetical protein Nmel_016012 [Mimus melanotis]
MTVKCSLTHKSQQSPCGTSTARSMCVKTSRTSQRLQLCKVRVTNLVQRQFRRHGNPSPVHLLSASVVHKLKQHVNIQGLIEACRAGGWFLAAFFLFHDLLSFF